MKRLLMRLEVGDALPDLLALGFYPFHGRYPVRFDDGARHKWLDPKALRKRHRFFDELVKVSFPISHGSPLSADPIGPSPVLPYRRVWTLWITGDGDKSRGRGCVRAVPALTASGLRRRENMILQTMIVPAGTATRPRRQARCLRSLDFRAQWDQRVSAGKAWRRA